MAASLARLPPPLMTDSPSLVGTSWALALDVGVERGTWMPPTWGASGMRAMPSCTIAFEDDGRLQLLDTGYFDGPMVKFSGNGGWTIDGERAIFWLEHAGLSKGDVVLEPGRLYFNAPCWGALLSRRGNLTIRQRKLGWIPFLPSVGEASFMVGTFRSQPVESEEPPAPTAPPAA